MASQIRYTEIQRFSPALIGLVCGVGSLVISSILIISKNNLPLGIALLLIVPAILVVWALAAFKMVTQVRDDGLFVQIFPLSRRLLKYSDIEECQPSTYRPIRDYGGWGIRYGFKGNALNMKGNRGVQLRLRNARPLLIGSQSPEELAEAIHRAMSQPAAGDRE